MSLAFGRSLTLAIKICMTDFFSKLNHNWDLPSNPFSTTYDDLVKTHPLGSILQEVINIRDDIFSISLTSSQLEKVAIEILKFQTKVEDYYVGLLMNPSPSPVDTQFTMYVFYILTQVMSNLRLLQSSLKDNVEKTFEEFNKSCHDMLKETKAMAREERHLKAMQIQKEMVAQIQRQAAVIEEQIRKEVIEKNVQEQINLVLEEPKEQIKPFVPVKQTRKQEQAITPSYTISEFKVEKRKTYQSDEEFEVHENRSKRPNHPTQVVKYLKEWLNENIDHPYPDEETKQKLCDDTGLTLNQLNHWYALR
jgi:hypothetical protein